MHHRTFCTMSVGANHLHGRPARDHRHSEKQTEGAATHDTVPLSIMMRPLATPEKNIGGGRGGGRGVRIEAWFSFGACLRVKNEKAQKKPPPPLCFLCLCLWLPRALHDPCHRTPKIVCSRRTGGWVESGPIAGFTGRLVLVYLLSRYRGMANSNFHRYWSVWDKEIYN